jgi:hypothetical protein
MDKTVALAPLARTERLIVQQMPNEVLVYDQDRHLAHCLNLTAALVWKNCDGKNTVARIASLVGRELQTPVRDEVVLLALDQLRKDHLLAADAAIPAPLNSVSRRTLIRAIGIGAVVALPAIISLTAPTPAAAATGLAPGSPCTSNGQCTSNQCTANVCV